VDHPIFTESIRRIREALADPAAPEMWRQAALRWADGPERDVLERCIHSSGDLAIAPDLVFWPEWDAASAGLQALAAGAPILTDTAMAAAAVAPMARRTFGNPVHCLLDWAPEQAPPGDTRSAAAVRAAWQDLTGPPVAEPQSGSTALPVPPPVVLIGSAPTALERLLELVVAEGQLEPGQAERAWPAPSLVIGMPVGFVGVAESKRRLAASGLAHIRLEDALLRAAWP
jgi:precorrin-8X/cobalt-precorrin-8 methylmutase